jgi:hypothetical protein
MANQENTRTPKQDLNQRQPPQREQQAGGNKNADKRGKSMDQKDRPMGPGKSARQPEDNDGTRH